MKAIINRTRTACVLVGYYDEDGQYREVIRENFDLNNIPERFAQNVYLDHDITMQVSPGIEIGVFAKCLQDIETYLKIENEPKFIEHMLECWSKHNKPSDDYIWTTIDFDELRTQKACLPNRVS